MKEQIVQHETAKLLKEIGFNYPVINQYIGDKLYLGKDFAICEPIDVNSDAKDRDVYSAPTQSLAQKWLREKYNVFVETMFIVQETGLDIYKVGFVIKVKKFIETDSLYDYYLLYEGFNADYEQAIEKGLQEAIKIVKNERNR